MRKVPGLVKSVVDLSLHSLTLVYDDPAWASKEDEFGNYVGDESDDDDEMASVAASTLDRLAKALGGKVVWPTFRECAAPYFASPKWQCRRAAVIAMSLIVEGCKRVLLPQVRGPAARQSCSRAQLHALPPSSLRSSPCSCASSCLMRSLLRLTLISGSATPPSVRSARSRSTLRTPTLSTRSHPATRTLQ